MLDRRFLAPFLVAWPTFLALLGAPACGPRETPAPDGQGLVLLPYDGPLGRGVEERDPRLNFHDFGRVSDGDTVTHTFRMQNSDPRPIAITRVDPGCGCTVASLRAVHADGTVEAGLPISSKAPKLLTVAPGDVLELEVRIATRDIVVKNAHKLITLRVLTDSPNGYFLTLEVHILVEQPFAVVPGTLALGYVPENGGGEGKVEIVPSGGFHYRLKELLPLPEGVHAELVEELRNEMTLWTLRAGLSPPLPRGPRMVTLKIATEESEGVPGREVEVPLTATVVSDLGSEPERIVFAAPRGSAARGSCELYSRLKGQRLRVLGLELPEGQRAFLTARYEPVEIDDDGTSLRWRITLETQPPLPEGPMLAGGIALRLDDPQHPTHAVEYVVHLR
jgi:hypothetical protein